MGLAVLLRRVGRLLGHRRLCSTLLRAERGGGTFGFGVWSGCRFFAMVTNAKTMRCAVANQSVASIRTSVFPHPCVVRCYE